jgi:predicted amino acid dehydrogenase
MFEKVKRFAKKIATSKKTQMTCLMVMCGVTALMAQTTAGDYSAGTAALTQVSEEIAKYVPIVVKLCYAIAGVVAVVGAISVYIAMNNEEQDVKNILVLRNAFEKTRKQMNVNTLSINALSDNLNFPMFAKLTLKKT